MVCADLPSYKELPERRHRVAIEFLMCELEIGTTFANIAITEQRFGSRDHEHEQRARENAMTAYSSFLRFLPMVQTEMRQAERAEIDAKRIELEELLASLRGSTAS